MGYKYELTDETRYGLKRLIITTDNAETLGGFVNNLDNVSGNAMVTDEAMVYGNARVYSNAKVYDEAVVYGNAEVYDEALVYGNARVYGDAEVYGNAKVKGNARVYDNAEVYGEAMVYGNAKVLGNSKIEKNSDYLVIGPIGSRDDFITFTNSYDGILATVGCFHGTLAEFKEKVKQTHADNKHAKAYLLECDLAEWRIAGV